MDLPTIGQGNAIVSGTTGSGGGGSGSGSSSSGSGDIGSHSAMTDGGLVYTIPKSYGSMTDGEKHDANNFAHNQSALGSG